MNITLRLATLKDIDSLATLVYDTITTVNAAHYDETQIAVWRARGQKREVWVRRIIEQHFLVATLDEQIVGMSSLMEEGHLDLLYIHREHQRRGIARQLLGAIERIAVAACLPLITADVSLTALPFFERQGFTVVLQQQVLIEGISLPNTRMVKRLIYSKT